MGLKGIRWLRTALLLGANVAVGTTLAQRVLLPGDRIQVRCAEAPLLCVERTVSFAGSIDLPGLPPISLAKLTSDEAAHLVEQVLFSSGRVADPHVSFRLLPARTKRVSVVGLVRNPGEVFARAGLTLQEALSEAGASPSADLSKVTVLTAEGQTLTVDGKGRPWLLHSGDRVEVLVLAGNSQVFVVGGVGHPGALAFEDGLTASEAIRRSGGVAAHGEKTGWHLRHGDESEVTTVQPDTVLRPGDTLEVPLSAERAFVSVTGAVRKAGAVPLRAGMKLTEALREAGGPLPTGDFMHIEIRSVVGGRKQVVNLLALLSGKQKDPVLMVGDTVVVPTVRVKGRA